MALTGSLREVEPADVFQLISMSRKTGVLTVATAQARSQVYFQGGRPVHATGEAGNGAEAVYNLLTRSEGDFSFEPAAIDCPVTITSDMETLMLEGMRRVDHISLLKDDLPAGDVVLRMESNAPANGEESCESADLTESARALLALVDGERTLAELVRASGLSAIDAHEALHQLISHKRVTERASSSAGAAGESAHGSGADGEHATPTTGDIERLIERIAAL
jgi:hypothetical protein